jgi:hypothetical protein
MTWTKEMEDAAILLGLDPEKQRRRIEKTKRGRPKGSVVWDEECLMSLALVVDYIKRKFKEAGEPITDEQILSWLRVMEIVPEEMGGTDGATPLRSVPLPSPATLRKILTRARRLKPPVGFQAYFKYRFKSKS